MESMHVTVQATLEGGVLGFMAVLSWKPLAGAGPGWGNAGDSSPHLPADSRAKGSGEVGAGDQGRFLQEVE